MFFKIWVLNCLPQYGLVQKPFNICSFSGIEYFTNLKKAEYGDSGMIHRLLDEVEQLIKIKAANPQ